MLARVATFALPMAAVLVTAAIPAAAQDRGAGSRGAAFDTVIGVQDFSADGGASKTQVLFDTLASVELLPGTQLAFRPVVWRMGGEWLTLVDQLSLRYEFARGSSWRLEAGRFPSPIGLGMMENRASTNAGVMWCHRPLYLALPPAGDAPPLSLVSAVYPIGAQVSTSTARWDARAALVDTAPVQYWHPAPSATTRAANGILGGGVTPWEGFRIGAAAAWGTVGLPQDREGQRYVLVNAEGEYAFRYTRISGEWTRDRFEAPGADRIADGWTMQVRQTVTPRLFVHTRFTSIEAPWASPAAPGDADARRFRAADSTVGYLLSPELTVRIGHTAIDAWTADGFDNQIGVSLIWTKRWW